MKGEIKSPTKGGLIVMTNAFGKKRTDSALRVIMASPKTIYQAFLDPMALVSWLPPKGMKGHIDAFDAQISHPIFP